MVGIYKITNKINLKKYIGQSVNIEKRLKRHKTDAFNQNSKSYDYPLYRSIRKYGLENFSFEVVELTKRAQLNEREIHWIEKEDSLESGYNQIPGGNFAPTYQKVSHQLLLEITKELKFGELNQEEIANKFKLSTEMIQGINTGRHWKRDINYPIRVSENSKGNVVHHLCKECLKRVSKPGVLCVECAQKERRLVERPGKVQLVKEVVENSFTFVAQKYGVSVNSVKKWCKNYNLGHKTQDLREYYSTISF